jgi:hypothetical protein
MLIFIPLSDSEFLNPNFIGNFVRKGASYLFPTALRNRVNRIIAFSGHVSVEPANFH